MATQLNSEGNFNELIFENRNKEYGAYVIRKSYNETVTKSLLITFSGVCALFLISMLFTNTVEKITKIEFNTQTIPDLGTEILVNPVIEKQKIKIEQPKTPEPPSSQTGALVASDKKEDVLNKTNDDFHIAKANVENGADSAAGPEIIDLNVKTSTVVVPPSVIVDEMPELKNMNQFIAENLSYPRGAIENGTSGTVYLSFVVETDGEVSDVKILRGIGDGCEQEAMRVVKEMPKWKPGKNHGQPVRVLFNLPVKFRLK